ncbi:Ctr copper transporter [Xylogone sp. PMI_703]|nr:Ctr copper transporter [Xylogone sp. PMI_703]
MNMDMDTNTSSMSSMASTFFTSSSTPLFSPAWSPSSTGSYAGTCIFLIVLAVIFRALLALKAIQEMRWFDREFNRRYVVVAGRQTTKQQIESDAASEKMVLTSNGVEEEVVVVKKRGPEVRPWRLSTDPARALFDTVLAGVAYLLMLAVMTFNVGYFLSVLGGTFLGSLLLGRYSTAFQH